MVRTARLARPLLLSCLLLAAVALPADPASAAMTGALRDDPRFETARAPRPEDAADGSGSEAARTCAAGRIARWSRWQQLGPLDAPSPAQSAYDVHYYNLDLDLNPGLQRVTGVVRVRAGVVSGPLSALELNFYDNMTITGITSAGLPATFSRAANRLTVDLDRSYPTGDSVDVVVSYFGTPATTGFGDVFKFDTRLGKSLIWSLSEPFGARAWWPCKDYPDDKADSVDIRVTVPTGMKTASNGRLVSSTDNGTSAVTVWQERYPITTYLVSVTSYEYTVTTDWYRYAPGDSMPIQFYTFPDLVGSAGNNSRVKEMIAAYAARFGEYPFLAEKYGHANFQWGGGMEHQTCTSLVSFGEGLIAHELSHQWWGDMTTCRDFHHIWLNEGFATWAEAVWWESSGGHAAYVADLNNNKYFGAGTIYVANDDDINAVFSSGLSYNKGSWVVHMLRGVLGDSLFFAGLARYRADHLFGTAVTEDLRDAMEAVSGRDLDRFFQEWIYGEYYPAYRYGYTTTPAGGGYDVQVTLDQTQSWQLFWMPVTFTVNTAGGPFAFTVEDSLASQSFTFHVPAAPTSVEIDKDEWILKTVEQQVSHPTFDRGVLLVNGVSWVTYGTEITTAYQDRAFWGDYNIDFWDNFSAGPPAGYPSTLPAPLGTGRVPAETLGRYRCVVWVGNNFGGDLSAWLDTSIQSYLEAGGNVLLMARQGDLFLGTTLRDCLGVSWTGSSTIYDCLSSWVGLTNITRIGTQNTCPLFSTTLTRPDSYLLYRADLNYNPDQGLGAIRIPAGGGAWRLDGGRFAFLSGRPYRWDHANLRDNVMWILDNLFLEPINVTGVEEGGPARPVRLEILPVTPNPSHGAARLTFTLPSAQPVTVDVFDAAGRRLRRLLDTVRPAGTQALDWDGQTDAGRPVASGIYWIRLTAGHESRMTRLTLVR